MTPLQYLTTEIYNLLMGPNGTNPKGLDPTATMNYAAGQATFYLTYILPNLQANLQTGTISFVVPSGS